MIKKETYSTRKAWGFGTAKNSEAKHFETIANSLRRENKKQRKQRELSYLKMKKQ